MTGSGTSHYYSSRVTVVGRFLPLIGNISASAFSILCKEDVRNGKGEDNADSSRKYVGISVVNIDNKIQNYILNIAT